MVSKYGPLIGAIDQGTSSSRFLVQLVFVVWVVELNLNLSFTHKVFSAQTAELITYHQVEVRQLTPAEGWVESDPFEFLHTVEECIDKTINNLNSLDIDPSDIKAVGICNQRETTIVWDKTTGKPLHNAISIILIEAYYAKTNELIKLLNSLVGRPY